MWARERTRDHWNLWLNINPPVFCVECTNCGDEKWKVATRGQLACRFPELYMRTKRRGCARLAHTGPQWRVARVRLRARGRCCNFTSHQLWSGVRLVDPPALSCIKKPPLCQRVLGVYPAVRINLSGVAWESLCTSGEFYSRPRTRSGCCAWSEDFLEVGEKCGGERTRASCSYRGSYCISTRAFRIRSISVSDLVTYWVI